ncbi:FadR/GntR family transcriptional regulator [Actinocorallia sp. A-T 12471]|uniref:FadR/GntR family transcriptional regulator n=1 Tax=Actinocorallia sp. A-T 12471 TaxID=3089813 RepID=UPI0029CB1D19|nr:FCD domain-containing protein [Actinocorallia sp. A-T 12471]MDX6740625.1 GntR family transcriptional regulator [Actinocorallia sp. A-T 12471]
MSGDQGDLSGKTFSWRIAQQLKQAVFSRKLTPGQRLGTEKTIAEEFGVSRMAARDALRTLQAHGVVDVKVGIKGGVFVSEADFTHISESLAVQLALIGVESQELLDAQTAIELSAIGLAAQNADEATIERLRTEFEVFRATMAQAAEDEDVTRFAGAALKLHEGLIEASGNRVLIGLFSSLTTLLEPTYQEIAAKQPDEQVWQAVHRVLTSHEQVLTALSEHDAVAAQGVIQERLGDIRAVVAAMTPARPDAAA